MTLDVRTLLACNLFVAAMVGGSLLFYRARQKTYDGFGLWGASSLLLAAGFALIALREAMPLWVSILAGHGCFLVGGLSRIDGSLRFIRGRRMKPALYAAVPAVLAVQAWLTFAHESLPWRTAVIGAAMSAICFTLAALFFRAVPPEHPRIFLLVAGLNLFFGIASLSRSLLWLANPMPEAFGSAFYQAGYFAAYLLVEIALGYCFLMLNNQRLEEEWRSAQERLSASLDELRRANAEVKVLSGLLPICAQCKKIRTAGGEWQEMEHYLHDHSEASFTHGLCPECVAVTFPGMRAGAGPR